MARIIMTALSAVTILALGIVGLQFREEELAAGGLSGADATALNLTRDVTSDALIITSNAIPRLFVVVLLVLLVVVLLLNR